MHNSTPQFFTVNELAELLRIGRSSAYELCQRNEFPVVRIGKNIRIPEQGLYNWIDEQGQQKVS